MTTDILGDPAIPKIPREELVIGARIGIGASGVVLQAEWNRPDGYVMVARGDLDGVSHWHSRLPLAHAAMLR